MTSLFALGKGITAAICVAHHAYAYAPGSGSFAAGNLNNSAPYGISPQLFGNVTQRLNSNATFNITGYNVSSSAGPTAIPGWVVTVGITDDVSLVNAANSSNFDTEVTTLFISPPGSNVTMDPSWRICAVVFPGLTGPVPASTSINGTCNSVLSAACMRDIQTGSRGMDGNGNCTNYSLPSSCASFFPTQSANSTTAFAINQTVLHAKRFYAFGSPPTQTNNRTAYIEARENVWPVITLFGHLSGGRTRTSLNTHVQCVRALNGTTTSPGNLVSGADRIGPPSPWSGSSQLLLSLVVAWALFL